LPDRKSKVLSGAFREKPAPAFSCPASAKTFSFKLKTAAPAAAIPVIASRRDIFIAHIFPLFDINQYLSKFSQPKMNVFINPIKPPIRTTIKKAALKLQSVMKAATLNTAATS
jgi:hypothetical protein